MINCPVYSVNLNHCYDDASIKKKKNRIVINPLKKKLLINEQSDYQHENKYLMKAFWYG